MICYFCLSGKCNYCDDIMNIILGGKLTCECKRTEHSGEPRDKQILDPTTGEIYAPGLKVTEDGEVKYSE